MHCKQVNTWYNILKYTKYQFWIIPVKFFTFINWYFSRDVQGFTFIKISNFNYLYGFDDGKSYAEENWRGLNQNVSKKKTYLQKGTFFDTLSLRYKSKSPVIGILKNGLFKWNRWWKLICWRKLARIEQKGSKKDDLFEDTTFFNTLSQRSIKESSYWHLEKWK